MTVLSRLVAECRQAVLEGAGDPDLHSKGVDLLRHMDLAPGPNPPPKWYRDEMPARKKKKRKPKEEYGSPGMSVG